MRLNLHAKFEVVVAMALLLGSCGDSQFSDAERDEIGDIAGSACADAVAEDDTIKDLKARIAKLESRLGEAP